MGIQQAVMRQGDRWPSVPVAIALALVLVIAAVRAGPALPATTPRAVVDPLPGNLEIWQTSPGDHWLVQQPDRRLASSGGDDLPAITIDPARRYQRIAGFGGAFNELGWQALLTLTPAARLGVMQALFDPVHGSGYSLARTPIGASDYALSAYSLDDMPGDRQMDHFSIERDQQYLLPYIRAALQVDPDLTMWGSPWSAPAWMKTNHSMIHGGSLIPGDEPAYARYLADYVQQYAATGVRIAAISIQNEPTQATYYPSMVMAPEQMARFIGHDLGPLFARLGLRTAIRVNEEPSRERWDYTLKVLADPTARPYISGSDIHGYHGSPAELQRLHQALPGLDIWQTEAMNLDHPHLEYADAERWAAAIARDLQSWASGWDFWNMVTDRTARSSWGWQQDAVVLVDTRDGSVIYTPKFFAMEHFSRFIRPGAIRIGIEGVPTGLAATAALNPDGRIALIVVNPSGEAAHFDIASGGLRTAVALPAHGIATYVWQGR